MMAVQDRCPVLRAPALAEGWRGRPAARSSLGFTVAVAGARACPAAASVGGAEGRSGGELGPRRRRCQWGTEGRGGGGDASSVGDGGDRELGSPGGIMRRVAFFFR
jgi:hypothetical protein